MSETQTKPETAEAQAPAPKKTFDEFLASVPEPESSGDVRAKEAPASSATGDQRLTTTPSSSSSDSAPQKDASTAEASPAPDLETIRTALKNGDLDALADVVGEDPALYSEKSTKWAAARRKERKLKEERDRVAQQAEQVVKRWSPVAELAGAVQAGDFKRLPELVELLTGLDYDAATLKTARARHGSDPQVDVLKRRLAELEPVVAETNKTKETAAERALHETLRDEVAESHQVRAFDGWEAKVAAVLKESFDEDLGEPSLSPKQAADRVLRREREEFDRRAKVFGGAPAAAAASKPRAPERASGAVGAPKRKLTREEWLAAHK